MDKKDILMMQEAERKRIAEEFHDTTVQDMICLSQQLELILLYMDQDLTRARLETAAAHKHVKQIINEMRETIYDLRPMIMDDIGWQASFERLRDKLLSEDANLSVCFDIDTVDTSDGITAISIYRIVCEGCQNIRKHSNAKRIDVSVKKDGELIKIRIQDNGTGIEKEKEIPKDHFGLQFMGERVDALSGKMTITSNSSGTEIKITIPTESGAVK